ncbi:hypothetical protein F5141DRAFT_1106903 [Pisolithus sp. B1]|nr:hypothetical protein F5141DRAFT_1106903 [Pisolithus sp. B1]
MRFALLTLFVAPFVTAVIGAAVSPDNAGRGGLRKKDTCITLSGTCDSLYVCCLGLVCAYTPVGAVGTCMVSFQLMPPRSSLQS